MMKSEDSPRKKHKKKHHSKLKTDNKKEEEKIEGVNRIESVSPTGSDKIRMERSKKIVPEDDN